MRYLATAAGTAHVVSKDSRCPVVKRNVDAWKGQRSLKPLAVLEGYRDCAKCETFKHAKSECAPVRRAAKTAKAPKSLKRAVDAVVELNAKLNGMPVADERTTRKIEEHAKIAADHGWETVVTANERRGLTLTATRGNEACVLAYRENGILWNDEIRFNVPGRSVPMHNSGTWRRQVSLPEGQRPIPAQPKRFGRKRSSEAIEPVESANGESTEDEINGEVISINRSDLPFPKDADDFTIIDAIKGQTLYWRNNLSQRVVSARVPSKARMIRLAVTGRGQRRYVSFPEAEMTKDGEMYGPERAVAIESMLRVRP